MIRFSPNSLASIVNGSRSSSASGSYGHLSAGALSPALGVHPGVHLQQLQAHLLRSAGAGLLPPPPPVYSLSHHPLHPHPVPPPPNPLNQISQAKIIDSKEGITEDVSAIRHNRQRFKKEGGAQVNQCSGVSSTHPGGSDATAADGGGDLKDEPGDFIETNCHWRECGTEFPTQDDLVKVIRANIYFVRFLLLLFLK